MSDFTCTVDDDGVALITWDVPGRSMNVLTQDGFETFGRLIDEALADDAVRGIVITSGKSDFAGGMDLDLLARARAAGGDDPAQGLFDWITAAHGVLRRLERAGLDDRNRGGKPVACAIGGTCAGIGTEIALACHHRVMTDAPDARVGLPEIKLGLFPGAGGTTRVSRMLGLLPAAPILLEGRMLDPGAARAAGLIDDTAPTAELVARARAWVLSAGDDDIVKPWDRKGWKMPGGAPYHPSGFETFVGAAAQVSGRTKGVYPAARAMLSAIYEGALVPFDTALRIEARWFTHVLLDPTAGAMIRTLFTHKTALEKGARRPAGQAPAPVRKLGVLGAGMMGAGIAHVAALAGLEVVLLDRNRQAAEAGRAKCGTLLEQRVTRRKMTAEAARAVHARITATTDHAALAGCDLVIEAVVEDPDVKAEAIGRAEAALDRAAVVASNTSTLPIAELARASARPERFLGLHFFSPVDRMALVEIIRTPQTSDAAVARAFDVVRTLEKTPIVVNDARFFYANRCIIPYLNEGIRMVGAGVAPALVENAALLAGMPVGPLQLVDETSIELGVRIARATRAAMGDAYPDAAVDAVIFRLAELERLGRKAGAGFYDYDTAGKRAGLWPGLRAEFPPAAEQPGVDAVRNRLLMIQALEAVRALEQGVLADIREGDVAAILGWGFAPWSGGPFAWLDRIGAGPAVALCDALADTHGARFAAPPLLRDLAAAGDSFHGRFAPAPAAIA